MNLLRINLFGGLEIKQVSGEPIALPSRKAATLLGYIALTSPQGISRSKLAAMLWEGRFSDNARASLRQTLLTLRRVLPQCADVILTERDDIRICPNAVSTDVQDFERLLQSDDLATLACAAALYRGELLEGIGSTSCAFEAWLSAERQRLRTQAMRAITSLLDVGGRERVEIAMTFSLRVLAADPLQEDIHRTLMRCYAQQGRRADALRQYDFCRNVLRKQVGATPEIETESLQREIRRMLRA
ncbi:AfsR/SARP family transcriptional regulator [Bradyrhizobium oligotrophicum]|uniref:AfsR/SARP family transcriptional regulator n=1 Tax=Bradyrhizobium oligotrophicum TaxID=44255 RepID=UPI003EBC716F